MMNKTAFTEAVIDAEPTLYRVAKTMFRSECDCAGHAILRRG